jgi:hypothetical protein
MHKIPVFSRRNWFSIALIMLVLGSIGVVFLNRSQGMHHEGGVSTARVTTLTSLLPTVFGTPRSRVSVTSTYCADNTNGKLLLVSISQQRLWACNGLQLAYKSAVTTGASALTNVDDATPIGTWHIYAKHTNTTLRGCDVNGCWNDPVAYWIPFDGSVGFHDASWQTFPFGGAAYATNGSHGCVHLPTSTAAWVYGWAPIGTTVTVRS